MKSLDNPDRPSTLLEWLAALAWSVVIAMLVNSVTW